MKKLLLAAVATALMCSYAMAAEPAEKYFVIRGKITELTATKLMLKDPHHSFIIHLDGKTPAPAGMKVGDNVAIQTRFSAMSIEAIPPKPAPGAPASAPVSSTKVSPQTATGTATKAK